MKRGNNIFIRYTPLKIALQLLICLSICQEFRVCFADNVVNQCVACHTREQRLRQTLESLPPVYAQDGTTGGRLSSLLIDPLFHDVDHGWLDCHDCHGGRPAESDFEAAHRNVESSPPCSKCHQN